MKPDRLRLPLKLARQALERARAELAGASDGRRAIENALQASRDARARETFEDASGLQPLASFVERSRRLERDLSARLAAAQAEEAARMADVGERRLELRRLELLEERAARVEQVAAVRRDRRALDDLVARRKTVR